MELVFQIVVLDTLQILFNVLIAKVDAMHVILLVDALNGQLPSPLLALLIAQNVSMEQQHVLSA